MALFVKYRDQRSPSTEKYQQVPASEESCRKQCVDKRGPWSLSRRETVKALTRRNTGVVDSTYGSGVLKPL